MEKPIAILLPAREAFAPAKAGALALSAREFALRSRYRNVITVYGPAVDEPYREPNFMALHPRGGWWRGGGGAYLEAFRRVCLPQPPALIEVWNRPHFLPALRRAFPAAALTLHLQNDPQSMRLAATPRQRMQVLEHCAAVYCCSDFIRDRFLDGMPETPQHERVHTIPNGVDLAQIAALRENLPMPDPDGMPKKRILFVGRMLKDKGVGLILEMIKRVVTRLDPEWEFVLIGGNRPGDTGSQSPLEKEAYALFDGLRGRGRLCGFVPHEEILREMLQAEIVLAPSLWDEPFGRIAAEAMVCGCAVMTTGRGGLGEIAGQDGAAQVIPDESPALWGEVLVSLTRHDDLRWRMQEKAHQRAAALFDLEMLGGRMDAVREKILSYQQNKQNELLQERERKRI